VSAAHEHPGLPLRGAYVVSPQGQIDVIGAPRLLLTAELAGAQIGGSGGCAGAVMGVSV
jgi:hypothetical protein